ncbi:MAG: DUF7660 family protein [Sciscionella sp.]
MIHTRSPHAQDLPRFVSTLRENLTNRGDSWENPSLDRFLDALAARLGSADHRAPNMLRFAPEPEMDVENPSWQLMALALGAARSYE